MRAALIALCLLALIGVPLLAWTRRRGSPIGPDEALVDAALPQTRALVLMHRRLGERAAAAELVASIERGSRAAVVVAHEEQRHLDAALVEARAGDAAAEIREVLTDVARDIRAGKG